MEHELNHDIFASRAEQILSYISQRRAETGLQEAINEIMEKFVELEPHPELVRLAEVLGLARRQAMIQVQLDDDREALHHGNLSHDERLSVSHHYEMLRQQACSYNHLLRGLIESCSQYFYREELMSWMVGASSGQANWAKGEITGAASEIALHAALQGLPEIRGLRYASVEEDLVGYDFVGEWQGKMLTVDAKTGFYPPLSEQKHGHRHLEISVPREVVKDLRVNHRGLALLRREVRVILQRDAGVEKHPPHHYFRAQTA
jgi:hypothetical protein